MEETDIKPIWYKFCRKDNTLDDKKTLLNYLRTIDDKELFNRLEINDKEELFNRLEIDDLVSRDDLCNILREDYNKSLSRNNQCHNEITISTFSDTEFISDLYFLKVNNIIFCLEEKDVKYVIEHGKNPHTTKVVSDEEIVKMKKWLATKRLHSIKYEVDEISDYQRARDRFIEFMDNPINTYFASDKFFNQLSITQLRRIPRTLESQTEFLTFTIEEMDQLKTFLLKDDLLVYLTGLLTEKFESSGDVQTSKFALKLLVDEMKLNTGLIKEELFDAARRHNWKLVEEMIIKGDIELTKEEAEELILIPLRVNALAYSVVGKLAILIDRTFDTIEQIIIIENTISRTTNNRTRLEVLVISDSTSLPEGIFDKLVNLERLRITFSNLTSLPNGIFDKLVNLKDLDIEKTNLQGIFPCGIFANNKKLERLIANRKKVKFPNSCFTK